RPGLHCTRANQGRKAQCFVPMQLRCERGGLGGRVVLGPKVTLDAPTTTGCCEQLTVFFDTPLVIQAGGLEGIIECHPMTVSFGVGEGPVDIEDDGPQRVRSVERRWVVTEAGGWRGTLWRGMLGAGCWHGGYVMAVLWMLASPGKVD